MLTLSAPALRPIKGSAILAAHIKIVALRSQLTNGDPTPFFTRLISAVVCLIILVTIPMSVPAVPKRVRAPAQRALARLV